MSADHDEMQLLPRVILRMHVGQLERTDGVNLYLGDPARAGKMRHVWRGDLLAEQASAFAILGDTRRARRLALQASRHEALPINLALAWASVDDAHRALDYLERESFLVYWSPQAVWWDPRFDEIRDEARFAGVLERVEDVWSSEWR